MQARNPTRHAFTLVETLIVVIIIAIAAAIAMPMVGNRSGTNLSAASRKIISDLTYAQNMAVSTQRTYYVRFAAGQYEICTKSGSNLSAITHPVDKGSFLVQFGANATESALASVTLTTPDFAGSPILAFDALGTPMTYDDDAETATSLSASESIVISCDDQTTTISIEPFTGEMSSD